MTLSFESEYGIRIGQNPLPENTKFKEYLEDYTIHLVRNGKVLGTSDISVYRDLQSGLRLCERRYMEVDRSYRGEGWGKELSRITKKTLEGKCDAVHALVISPAMAHILVREGFGITYLANGHVEMYRIVNRKKFSGKMFLARNEKEEEAIQLFLDSIGLDAYVEVFPLDVEGYVATGISPVDGHVYQAWYLKFKKIKEGLKNFPEEVNELAGSLATIYREYF